MPCSCQRFGKSGVPHVDTFRCLVCGEPVDREGAFVCPAFRPDHNGECLTCDEWADEHTPEAIAAGGKLVIAGPVRYECPVCQWSVRLTAEGDELLQAQEGVVFHHGTPICRRDLTPLVRTEQPPAAARTPGWREVAREVEGDPDPDEE